MQSCGSHAIWIDIHIVAIKETPSNKQITATPDTLAVMLSQYQYNMFRVIDDSKQYVFLITVHLITSWLPDLALQYGVTGSIAPHRTEQAL
jgi:hypothetical protein